MMKPLTSLTTLHRGQSARLEAIDLEATDACRLRSLGLCEGCSVEVVQPGERMILRVGGCRLGLHRELAERVVVRREHPTRDSNTPVVSRIKRSFRRIVTRG